MTWPQPRTQPRPKPHPRGLLGRLLRFARDDGGSATVEFALIAPAVMFLFLASFESGMLMVRQVMLDRALDVTVRHVRLGHFDTTTDPDGRYANLHRALKATMCQTAANPASCTADLRLEMVRADPRAWSAMGPEAQCEDRRDDTQPELEFTPGVRNQLMILRACELFDPFFPTWGLGKRLSGSAGFYALTSSTAYVIEPS